MQWISLLFACASAAKTPGLWRRRHICCFFKAQKLPLLLIWLLFQTSLISHHPAFTEPFGIKPNNLCFETWCHIGVCVSFVCCAVSCDRAVFRREITSEYVLSPAEVPEKDPGDLLNKKKCLEYLAALRHAKWFQVNYGSQPSSNTGWKFIDKFKAV